MGMVTNFVGIQKDFTVPCGVRADVGLRVKRADGSPAAVGRATWRLGIWRDGAEAVATRFGELLPRPEGAGDGDLFWRFPVLEAGLWRYELTARGSDGEVARVFYGVIGSAAASDIVAAGEVVGVKGWRMLEVLLPEVAGGKVEAHWLSGDYVLALCEVARGEADRSKTEADRAKTEADRAAGIASGMQGALDDAVAGVTDRAEAAAKAAAGSAASAASAAKAAEAARDEAVEAKDVVVEKFEETDEFIEAFWDRAFSVIVPSSLTGTWVIGGRDTGEFYRGADGLSPVVGGNGNWLTWSWDSGTWVDSGTRAEGKNGFSPYVNSLGFWVYVDPVTGELTQGDAAGGKDGRDGDAIVRHVVESYEDIPWTGETCNGGHVYYVAKELDYTLRQLSAVYEGEAIDNANVRGEFVFAANRVFSRTGGAKLLKLGIYAPAVSNGEPSSELLWAHLYYEEGDGWLYAATSTDAVSQVASASSWWSFAGVVLPQGRRVRVLLSQSEVHSVAEADGGTETVRVSMTRASDGSKCGDLLYACKAWWQYEADCYDGYDVYSWVVLPDGSEGWVKTSAAYDVASADVYGLVKLGTDRVVSVGAPVGRNASGQAYVPTAEASVAGTVRVSNAFDPDTEVRNEGGSMHMSADGVILADKATPKRFGAVRLSFNRQVGLTTDPNTGDDTDWGNTNCLGVQADGKTSVQVAEAFQWGVSRVGTSVRQSNGMPWILPVGMADKGVKNEYGSDIRGQLMNNLLMNGALRTMVKADWLANLPPGMVSADVCEGNAFGFLTSDSFRQSKKKGLELAAATDKLLGGVKVMETLGSGTAVPTGTAVVDYLDEHYYTKSEVYTKAETVAQIRVVVPDVVSGMLASYATKSWTQNGFVSKSDYNAWKERVTELFVSDGNLINANTQAINANKKACDAAISSLTSTVNANKTACDNSVAQLNGRIAALEGKTDGYLKMVGAFAGTVELWGGTAEEFAKVDITGKRMFMTLEN